MNSGYFTGIRISVTNFSGSLVIPLSIKVISLDVPEIYFMFNRF